MSDVLAELIVADIFENGRTFLPGVRPTPAEVFQSLRQPILMGDLDDEECALLLSVLPANAERLSLVPLDKGLSGSKVFQARYDPKAKRRSKPFVVKVGPLAKLDREAEALNEIVAPTILQIGPPVLRRGRTKAALVQSLASLSERSKLESLRNRVRTGDDGPQLVDRVLRDRLGPWYQPPEAASRDFVLGELFEPYLGRGPQFGSAFPPDWDDLFDWVKGHTSCRWECVEPSVAEAAGTSARLRETVVHGDLHTQNILVDGHECWPIDFGWTRDNSSPLVDLAMLECSLKFLAVPRRSELRPLLAVEKALGRSEPVLPNVGRTPYGTEGDRVFRTVQAVRRFAMEDLAIPEDVYRLGLLLMTFALATHEGLNTPFVVASLQILASVVQGELKCPEARA
jgi:hypothetical protein